MYVVGVLGSGGKPLVGNVGGLVLRRRGFVRQVLE
jgi:hypothetical protein